MADEQPPAPPTPAAALPTTPPEAAPEADAGPVDFQARAVEVLRQANETAGTGAPAKAPPSMGGAPPAPPAPAAGEEKPKEDLWSTKFAQLNEASRRARAEQEAEKAKLREDREALRRDQAELDLIRQAKASGRPVEALRALGWTYEDATNEVLGKPLAGKREPEAAKVDPHVAKLQEKLQALEQTYAQERERAAEAEFRAGLVQLAAKEPDRFELVRAMGAYDEALAWTLSYVRDNGCLPGETQAQAMEEALAQIERRHEERLLKPEVLTAKKVRQRLTPAEAPKPAAARPQASPAKTQSTLTNPLAAAAPPKAAKPEPRTPDEFRAAAAAILRGDAD